VSKDPNARQRTRELGTAEAGRDTEGRPACIVWTRVRYVETDQMGVVYHGNFFPLFELARTELLRALGVPYSALEREGIFLAVWEIGAKLLSSAYYDDVLKIIGTMTEVKGARIRIDYEIYRDNYGGDSASAIHDPDDPLVHPDELVATGFTVLASLNKDRRPVRMPAVILEKVSGSGVTDRLP
jgi:acyl-CoA thioester hydrolase